MKELIEKLIEAAREYGADASLETANAEMDAQIALRAELAAAQAASDKRGEIAQEYYLRICNLEWELAATQLERNASQAEVERLREAIDFVLFNIHPSLTTEDVETIRAEMKRAKQGGAK